MMSWMARSEGEGFSARELDSSREIRSLLNCLRRLLFSTEIPYRMWSSEKEPISKVVLENE